MSYPEGHILGGTSSLSKCLIPCIVILTLHDIISLLDGLAYTRGSSDDYDRYAKLTDDPGWSWSDLQPYFRKVRGIPLFLYSIGVHVVQNERLTTPADHHNTTGEFDPSVHGYHGINSVSLPSFVTPFDYRVMKATTELPHEFPFNLDTNSGYQIGIGACKIYSNLRVHGKPSQGGDSSPSRVVKEAALLHHILHLSL